jgi:hypothetical protein
VECRGFSPCHGPFLSSDRWEVVQSVVHQTLDLIILVRVQASQPIQISPFSVTGWLRPIFVTARAVLPCTRAICPRTGLRNDIEFWQRHHAISPVREEVD